MQVKVLMGVDVVEREPGRPVGLELRSDFGASWRRTEGRNMIARP